MKLPVLKVADPIVQTLDHLPEAAQSSSKADDGALYGVELCPQLWKIRPVDGAAQPGGAVPDDLKLIQDVGEPLPNVPDQVCIRLGKYEALAH